MSRTCQFPTTCWLRLLLLHALLVCFSTVESAESPVLRGHPGNSLARHLQTAGSEAILCNASVTTNCCGDGICDASLGESTCGSKNCPADCPTCQGALPAVTCPLNKPTVDFKAEQCRSCQEITFNTFKDTCMYDVRECMNVGPGSSCEIDCAGQYLRVGNKTKGMCPAGNSNPSRLLIWEKPVCECPEPPLLEGYIKYPPGCVGLECKYRCTDRYSGTPVVKCAPDSSCNVTSYLDGCHKLTPCAPPLVDECRFDVKRCAQVRPGSSCEIHCKAPLLGNFTVAVCPDKNTNATTELIYYPLTCLLETCPDPSPWPRGYNKTESGKWVCATGYNGTAKNRCALGNAWNTDCSAVAELSGCFPIVPCLAPTLTGIDACKFDMRACQSVNPGEKCDVQCLHPFSGTRTEAHCPVGNVNPNGLVWTKPPCGLESCAEPGSIPAGYIRTGSAGWQCAQSYTGFAQKMCVATLSCEAMPVLTGCSQEVPCEAQQSDCRYDMSGCVSVRAGQSCNIRCKVPFSGSTTQAECPSRNTNRNGLVWSRPQCFLDDCADPPQGNGYIKGIDGSWECAPGFSGTVNKTCHWLETECRAEPTLSGCVREQPCKVPEVDSCKYDVSLCNNVPAGRTCTIRCKAPYLVPAGSSTQGELFQCPFQNTNSSRPLSGTLPVCGCGEPYPLPRGYNRTEDPVTSRVTYRCEPGYAGQAEQSCAPGNGPTCTVDPILRGCSIPVPCEASFNDPEQLSSGGNIRGRVDFGPASMQGTVNEDYVQEYRIYWANGCQDKLAVNADPIGVLNVRSEREACCRGDAYSLELRHQLPEGALGLLVLSSLRSGEAPVGVFISLNLDEINRAVLSAMAHPAVRPTFVCLVAVIACLLLGIEQQASAR